MAFFQFGNKLEAARDYSLEEIPVFSSLTPAEQKRVEKKARLLEYKRGDIVYEESDAPEAFYVVISGRFRLFNCAKTKDGGEQTLTYFHRGDHFGETSLLTNHAHSATVEARRSGLLLKLDKADFQTLIKDIPAISVHLSRSLGHRLTKKKDASGRREVKISALYSVRYSPHIAEFWIDYAASLNHTHNSPVILVDFSTAEISYLRDSFKGVELPTFDLPTMDPSKDSDLDACVVTHAKKFDYLHVETEGLEDAEKHERKIMTLLTFLTYRYNFLLLRLPADIQHIAFKVLKQSDYVYVYGESEHQPLHELAKVLSEFQQSFGFSKSEIRLLIPEDKRRKALKYEEKENILGLRIFSIIPPKVQQPERYKNSLRYLSKELAGTLVGLALGSGAAHGLAHIGVLRVLEREGIEVDIIAGASIGALIGAFWAAGYDANQLEKLARSIDKKTAFFKLIGFRDISMPLRGFVKGNQIRRFMKTYLGKRTFQDLKIPVKISAADLLTSEEINLDRGNVVNAIRASISIPGIVRPFAYQGRNLIDGGIIDPLPVRLLTSMGVKKIIGVNVLPGPRDRRESEKIRIEKMKREREAIERKGVWGRMLSKLLSKVQNRYAVNTFNVIMNTVQFMEFELADAWSDQADVLIHPIVLEANWAEFYQSEKFIKIGEEKTLEQIETIKKLIEE